MNISRTDFSLAAFQAKDLESQKKTKKKNKTKQTKNKSTKISTNTVYH